jgi:hypothetical protein
MALLAVAPASAATDAPVPLRIIQDPGGELGVRLRHVAHLRAQGTPVRIEGNSHSACTLYLALDRVCVTPQARLGFHGPRAPAGIVRASSTGRQASGLSAAEATHWTTVMAAHYPEPLRGWFLARMAEDPTPLRVLPGAQLIAAGMPACD